MVQITFIGFNLFQHDLLVLNSKHVSYGDRHYYRKCYSAILGIQELPKFSAESHEHVMIFHNSVSWDIETMRPFWALKQTQDTTRNKGFAFTHFTHDLYHNVVCVMERVKKWIKNHSAIVNRKRNIFSFAYSSTHFLDNYILLK